MNNYQDFGIIQFKLANIEAHQSIISTTTQFIEKRPSNQIVIFNSYNEMINNHKVPILHLSHSKFFYGNIVTMDIESLEFAQNCTNKKSIIYYADSIPWEKNIQSFKYWKQLFDNADTKVVALNQTIYDIFSIGICKPLLIAPEFSYETFKDIL